MISIVIPTRNEEKNIGNVLRSIKENDYRKKYEVIVVDGNSSDKTVEISRRMGARVIIQKGKLGVGSARNLGWKNARGDIIVFLEADHKAAQGFLKKIDETFEDKKIIAARPEIKVVVENWFQKIMSVQIELSSRRQKVWEFPIIFRKSVLEKTGGYDEKLSFAEDREFPQRLRKMGIKSKLIKRAVLYVKPIDSLKKLWRQGLWYGKNMIPYVKKSKDYLVVISVFIHSLAMPFLILGIVNNLFLFISGFLFLLMFLRAIQGFLYTKNFYAVLLPLIWIIRGTSSLIGMIISPFAKHRGR
ncbi:MAG: glycosyltransferase [Candidatus Nanoarchaeia archaeon]